MWLAGGFHGGKSKDFLCDPLLSQKQSADPLLGDKTALVICYCLKLNQRFAVLPKISYRDQSVSVSKFRPALLPVLRHCLSNLKMESPALNLPDVLD